MPPSITLRPAQSSDQEILQHWDKQQHVIDCAPNDAWDWPYELSIHPAWREMLIAETDGRPIGIVQIIDPETEESQYWGSQPPGIRALDIWLGEATDLGKGYGTAIMDLTIRRCFNDPHVHTILIDPLASNVKAQRFYERLGFRFLRQQQFDEDSCFVYALGRAEWEPQGRDLASNL